MLFFYVPEQYLEKVSRIMYITFALYWKILYEIDNI